MLESLRQPVLSQFNFSHTYWSECQRVAAQFVCCVEGCVCVSLLECIVLVCTECVAGATLVNARQWVADCKQLISCMCHWVLQLMHLFADGANHVAHC